MADLASLGTRPFTVEKILGSVSLRPHAAANMPFVHHHAPDRKPSPGDTCLVIEGDRLLARTDSSGVVCLPEFGDLTAVAHSFSAPLYVGLLEDRGCWAIAVEKTNAVASSDWQWVETRTLLTALTAAESHAVSCARQLLWWDRRHRFCGVCGTATIVVAEERARQCPKCAAMFFPSAAPAIIVAVTRGDELLLAHNRNFRAGMFSLLAGFVDPGETLEQAVIREVREEVGIEVTDLRYVTSQPWPYPNSLMVGFRASHATGELQVDGKEIEAANWFRRDAIPDIPRRGTIARHIIDRWLAE